MEETRVFIYLFHCWWNNQKYMHAPTMDSRFVFKTLSLNILKKILMLECKITFTDLLLSHPWKTETTKQNKTTRNGARKYIHAWKDCSVSVLSGEHYF